MFAREVKVPRARLSKTDNDNSMPSLETVAQIATKFSDDINWMWLLTGEGEMLEDLSTKKIIGDGNRIQVGHTNKSSDHIEINKTDCMHLLHSCKQKVAHLEKELESKNKIIELLEMQLKDK